MTRERSRLLIFNIYDYCSKFEYEDEWVDNRKSKHLKQKDAFFNSNDAKLVKLALSENLKDYISLGSPKYQILF